MALFVKINTMKKPSTPIHSRIKLHNQLKNESHFMKIDDGISFPEKIYRSKIINTSETIFPPSPIPIQQLLKQHGFIKKYIKKYV